VSFKSIVVLVAATCIVGAGCSSSSKTATSGPSTTEAGATTTTGTDRAYTRPVCPINESAPVAATKVAGSTSDYDITSFDGTKIRTHWFPLQGAGRRDRAHRVQGAGMG